VSDVANLGLIRPPLVYLVSIGVVLMLLAGVLFTSAVRTFRKAGTPVPGNRPTTAMVRTGPYGFSRNPVYLAFTLFQAGLAASINSVGVLLALLPALALMGLVVIPREERYLEARFPSEYPAYRREVRRWL